jgi:hypothetical protein
MKLLKNKSKTTTLLVIALLLASLTLLTMSAEAQEGVHGGSPQTPVTGGPIPVGVTPSLTIQTIPYLSFSPNPIGIGQPVLVNIWVQPATVVNRAHTGYTVTIAKPDGTTTTVGPMVSYQGDTTAWFEYVPDQIGTYQLQFFFAGDYYPVGRYIDGVLSTATSGGYLATQDVYYAPSQTAKYNLVVQSGLVSSWPPSPLPTDYWTRPISPENREWWVIGGNCPYNEIGGGSGTEGWPDNTNVYASNYKFFPYVLGPNSGHVVWRKQGNGLAGLFGGLIDGAYTKYQAPDQDISGASFAFGTAGPGNGGNPSILFEGRAYQSLNKVLGGVSQTVWECFNIRTGEIYWDVANINQPPTVISYAENTPPVPGALGRTDRTTVSLVYIGSSRVIKYNPITGSVTLNVSIPVTTGTLYADPYVLSTQSLTGGNYRLINWTLQGLSSTNFATNIISNISYPFSSVGTADYESMVAVSSSSSQPPGTGVSSIVRLMAASLTTGQLLWNISTNINYPIFSGLTGVADHGKYAQRFDDGHWYCWDLFSGKLLWTSDYSSYPWGTFGAYAQQSAYGLIFYNQYDGIVAYDWNTGKVVWHFHAPSAPFETPYTTGTGDQNGEEYSFFSDGIVADGKLYTYSVEHSPTAPLTRGWRFFCVNATTGEGIWNVTGAMIPGVVADGYITASDYYDGYMYVFGKGQSATTVTAPDTAVPEGTAITIKGTVMDMSPGDQGSFQNPTAPANSPTKQGTVPCVSADSMATQMEYLYMQHPIDGIWHNTSMTGVLVVLTAIDSNNNPTDIGTVTTNPYYGTFSYAWTPPKEGTYTITASFAGDDSYGSSSAATGLTVGPAPEIPTTPSYPVPADYTWTIIGTGIAVIIALAIAVLLLRKR